MIAPTNSPRPCNTRVHSNAEHRLSQSRDIGLVVLRCGSQYPMILRQVSLWLGCHDAGGTRARGPTLRFSMCRRILSPSMSVQKTYFYRVYNKDSLNFSVVLFHFCPRLHIVR